ncbi:MAG: cohesin domain-containing protein [Euryarchaeota archaeon]|nr:cohesin domain-containing protein [Euryarchaeota archaeon]
MDAKWYDDEVTVPGTKVSVNAPTYVEGTFNATIRIDSVTDLSSGQFDLSFNSSVVNVTEVKEGEIDGVAVPIFMWNSFDADTVRVLISMPMDVGVNGSGYLAKIEFEVKDNSGEKSMLDLSNRQLVDTKAKKIDAEWYDGEVTVL